MKTLKFSLQLFATQGTSGNDTLTNYSSYVTIYGYGGDDSIYNSAGSVTISGGADDDTVYHYYENYVSIDGGTGNDSIYNYYGWHLTIDGGEGVDTIIDYRGSGNSINGGDGADRISLNSSAGLNTVNGGAGNDTIYGDTVGSYGALYQFTYGDGSDLVYNYKSADSISIGSGLYYTTLTSGNDVLVSIYGSGAMTLKNAAGKTLNIPTGIYSPSSSGSGKNISNSYSDTIIYGSDYNDIVYNTGASLLAYGYGGNDSIYNSASYVTIYGGNGNDTIQNVWTSSTGGNYVSLNGGAGSDYIYNYWGLISTIDGGADNDTINLNIAYLNSINGGAGADRISLTSSWGINTVIGGTGNDTIYGDSVGTYGVVYQYNYGDGYDTIYNFNSNDTLNFSGTSYSTTRSGNDLIYYTSGGAITLKDYFSDIAQNINNTISGMYITSTGDANDTIKNTGSSSRLYGYGGNDSIYNSASYVTIFGGTGDDIIQNVYNYGGDYVSIDGGAGSDYIYNNYGYYLTIDGGADSDTINVYRGSRNSINGGAGADKISLGTNYGSSTVIGGTGNDTIYGDSVSSYSILYRYTYGDGYDTIYNFKSADTLSISGTTYSTTQSGNDLIYYTSGGAITLKNYRPANTAKNINNTVSGSNISTGDGKDTIKNTGSSVKAYGYGGNDSIYNSASYVTISGGNGNDTIQNVYNYGGDRVSIDGGAGSDYIYNNYGWYLTINGGADSDTINVYRGSSNSINGGAGNDRISLSSSSGWGTNTVTGGTGNDIIYGDTVYTYGVLYRYTYGDGYDTIYNFRSTDTLSISGTTYSTTQSGNDLIYYTSGGAITLKNYKPANSAKNINNTVSSSNIYTTDGKDTIKNTGASVKAYGYGGNDSVYNSASYVSIFGGNGNDTIQNVWNSSTGGNYVSIDGGASNDYIYNNYGWYLTIDGGADSDTITAYRDNKSSINGGAGNDRISLNSSYGTMTVKGGTGNDTIYSNNSSYGVLYQYEKGDGNDIIYGYKSADSITITGGATWSSQKSGNDIILTVGNGKITLNGANGKSINVYPKSANTTTTTTTTTTNTTTKISEKEVIQRFMKYLDTSTADGIPRLNQAVNYATNGYYKTVQAVFDDMVMNCQATNNATKFLKDFCGIDLDDAAKDTGAITGSDAGGSKAKTATSIVPEIGSLKTYTGNSFGITKSGNVTDNANSDNALNIRLIDKYGNTISYSNLNSSSKRYIWNGIYTWWAKGALDLISESYGSNYSFGNSSSATFNNLNVLFYSENDGALSYMQPYVYNGKTTNIILGINMNYYSSIDTSSQDGKDPTGQLYYDRTLAHEFTHMVMAANIDYFSQLPRLINEGTAELVHGIDDVRTNDIKRLAGNSNLLKKALRLSPEYSSSEVVSGVNAPDYAGGYMFFRYLAKQASKNATYNTNSNTSNAVKSFMKESSTTIYKNNAQNKSFEISGALLKLKSTFDEDSIDLSEFQSTVTKVDATKVTKGIMILGNTRADSITATSYADTISGNTGNDTISGGKGNDVIFGDSGNDVINGGDGNDQISGGVGNNTLTGGNGADVFVYEGGNDLITDYEAGKDKIQIADAVIDTYSINGSNVIFTIGNGKLTIKGGVGKQITTVNQYGVETKKSYGSASTSGTTVSGGVLTVGNTYASNTVDLSKYSGATKVNASAVNKALTINGNGGGNSIRGGNGNDTLRGYGGNDTLTGGAGNDVFNYDTGNDVITDYNSEKDKIKISNTTITGYSISGNNVILKTSKGNITVQNAAGKNITVIDSNGNQTTKTYGSSTGNSGLANGLTYEAYKKGIKADNNFTGNSLDVSKFVSTVVNINAANLSKSVNILGNGKNNSLKGGAGNDTLSGYGGNDTLTGDKGNDVFVYSAGNDVITDYTAGQDKIKFNGATISSYYSSGNNVVLKTNKGNVTVQNAKGKNITVINSNGTQSNQKYRVANSQSQTLNLICDDNFITNETSLDDISKVTPNSYSVGSIDTLNSNPNNLDSLQIVSNAHDSLSTK